GYARRDVAILDCKRAAESTALLGRYHLLHGEARKPGQQSPGLVLHAHLTQTGTRIVVRNGSIEATVSPLELEDAEEEIGQLPRARYQPLHIRTERGEFVEQFRIVSLDHAAAGSRWDNYIIALLEFGEDFSGQHLRRAPISGVVARLTTACLCQG